MIWKQSIQQRNPQAGLAAGAGSNQMQPEMILAVYLIAGFERQDNLHRHQIRFEMKLQDLLLEGLPDRLRSFYNLGRSLFIIGLKICFIICRSFRCYIHLPLLHRVPLYGEIKGKFLVPGPSLALSRKKRLAQAQAAKP